MRLAAEVCNRAAAALVSPGSAPGDDSAVLLKGASFGSSFTYKVPEGAADELYLWCSLGAGYPGSHCSRVRRAASHMPGCSYFCTLTHLVTMRSVQGIIVKLLVSHAAAATPQTFSLDWGVQGKKADLSVRVGDQVRG